MLIFPNQKCKFHNPVVTMGTFDGIHLGHQKLLRELILKAKSINGEAVVITYFRHPLETIHRNTFPYLLTDFDTREKLLHKFDIDCLLYLNFTPLMAEMEPLTFLKDVLYKEIKPSAFVIGHDTHFGKNRQGNYEFLSQHAAEFGFDIDVVEPYRHNGKVVSSSWCRECLRTGRVEELLPLLGRYYSITGKVVPGKKLGSKIGYPTANLKWQDQNILIPQTGIYLTQVFLHDHRYWSLTNVGYRPTVSDDHDLTIETYILNFNKNIYDQEITISFENRLRPEYKLKDITELKQYINSDINAARLLISRKE